MSQQNGTPVVTTTDYQDRLKWIIDQITQISNTIQNDDRGLVLSQQEKVGQILQEENARLLAKKKSVELATESQNRLVTLNENYNKRMLEYIKMMIVLALSLAMIAITVGFGLSSTIVILVSIITMSITFIFCFSTYMRMLSRDNIYYDEIKLNDVDVLSNTSSPTAITGNSDKSTVSSSSFLKCYGSDCCDKGTSWDSSKELCTLSPIVEKLTLINSKHCGGCNKKKDKKKSNDHSHPYEPSEFDLYAKI